MKIQTKYIKECKQWEVLVSYKKIENKKPITVISSGNNKSREMATLEALRLAMATLN